MSTIILLRHNYQAYKRIIFLVGGGVCFGTLHANGPAPNNINDDSSWSQTFTDLAKAKFGPTDPTT